MAELFKNFNLRLTSTGSDAVLVPSGLPDDTEYCVKNGKKINASGADTSFGTNIRTTSSIVQVHSLYMSNYWSTRLVNENRYKETSFKHVDLYIGDDTYTNYKIYVAYDIELVPGCPFYIEKNITLTPSQKLYVYAPQSGQSTTGNTSVDINVTAAAIEFISDTE